MKTQGQFTLFETLGEFARFLEKPVARNVVRIQNHHTEKPDYRDFDGSNHFARLEAMKSFHVKVRKFADISQNLTTFPDGTVAVCRKFELAPACAKGANAGAICIENLGNFDRNRDEMTTAQRECIVQVNAMLCRKFKLPVNTDTIVYHHWFDLSTGKRTNGSGTTKSCPGTAFFGGNKVAHCNAGLIPLVKVALARLEAPVAIPVMVVSSPDGVLSIRSGPSVGNAKLGELTNGTVVQIHEARGIWRRIDPAAQRWVSSHFLLPH